MGTATFYVNGRLVKKKGLSCTRRICSGTKCLCLCQQSVNKRSIFTQRSC